MLTRLSPFVVVAMAPGCVGVESAISKISGDADTATAGQPACSSGAAILASLDSVYCLNLNTSESRRIEMEAPNAFNIVDGLALDEEGRLFSACFGNLYEVTLESGEFRWVGGTANGFALTALPDGRLLATGRAPDGSHLDSLYVVDPDDGDSILVNTGSEFNVDGDLAAHPNGSIYWTVSDSGVQVPGSRAGNV